MHKRPLQHCQPQPTAAPEAGVDHGDNLIEHGEAAIAFGDDSVLLCKRCQMKFDSCETLGSEIGDVRGYLGNLYGAACIQLGTEDDQ